MRYWQNKTIKNTSLYLQYLVNDSSYSVSGAALDGLIRLNPDPGVYACQKIQHRCRGKLGTVVAKTIVANAMEEDFDFLLDHFKKCTAKRNKNPRNDGFATYLAKVKNADQVKKGVDAIMKFRNQIPEQYRGYIDPV